MGRREYARSLPYAWSASGVIGVDTSFLKSYIGKMEAPEVESLIFRFTGSVTTNSVTTFVGEDACRIFSLINVKDAGGDRVNLDGVGTRLVDLMEYGSSFMDPANQAATTTNTAYNCFLRIPFGVFRGRRRADTRISVEELLSENGGQINITTGAAVPITGVTVNSGNLEVWAELVDAGKKEAHSRMAWYRYNAPNAEDYYAVNGSLRAAFMYATNGATTAGLADWSASTYASLDSYTLAYTAMARDLLIDEYYRESSGQARILAGTSVDSFMVAAQEAYPIWMPRREQKVAHLPDVGRLHVKLGGAGPSGAQIAICAITDRIAANAVKVSGARSLGELEARAATVSNKHGAKTSVAQVPDLARRRLPFRLAGEV